MSDGWKRGEKGFGKDGSATKFAKADFDRAKQQGPLSDGGADGGLEPSDHDKGFRGVKS